MGYSVPKAGPLTSLASLGQHPPVKPPKAIAAMSLNRVIGAENKIPWHLPDDFKWFKKTTTGQILVMGRKTFESIGKPLPNRLTIVLSRAVETLPGVVTISNLSQLPAITTAWPDREIFICGGAQVYQHALPMCSDLFLTVVGRQVEGDTLFPPFEDTFELVGELHAQPEFKILHYQNRCRTSL